jgi:hypothetical protein
MGKGRFNSRDRYGEGSRKTHTCKPGHCCKCS